MRAMTQSQRGKTLLKFTHWGSGSSGTEGSTLLTSDICGFYFMFFIWLSPKPIDIKIGLFSSEDGGPFNKVISFQLPPFAF